MIHEKHIFRDGIIGLTAGDALGAPAEFGERWMRDMDPVREMRSGGIFEVPVGGWTDDTSMTLATLDSLRGGYDPEDIMRRFVSWLRTGEYSLFDEPIGKQILRAIERFEQSGNIRSCGGTEESDNGNGSLMRILPICLFGYLEKKSGRMTTADVLNMVHEASALTHNHPRSLIACGVWYFITESILDGDGPLNALLQAGIDQGIAFYRSMDAPFADELSHYARTFDLNALRLIPRDAVSSTGYVVDTLEAALWSLATTDTFEACLLKAVNLGLDTDTIAAIAGGVAGLYYGYDAIPAQWRSALQKREEIESLCAVLDAKQTEV